MSPVLFEYFGREVFMREAEMPAAAASGSIVDFSVRLVRGQPHAVQALFSTGQDSEFVLRSCLRVLSFSRSCLGIPILFKGLFMGFLSCF